MAAKVKWDRGAWWVITHTEGMRWKRRVGSSTTDKRDAQEIAKKINAKIALGEFAPSQGEHSSMPAERELWRWHAAYSATFKPSYQAESARIIRSHLVPFFGSRDLRDLREADLLDYIRAKLDAGHAPKTIRNALGILRRVLNLLERDGRIARNPATRSGELMRRVDRSVATETHTVDTWSPEEVSTLLQVALEHEPQFQPALATLFYAGLRRGELLGLKWEDVDFDRRRIHVRRAYVKGQITTPKSGRGRYVMMAPPLASLLLDVLATRSRQMLAYVWAEVPEWVFPSRTGGPLDQDNFDRTWRRLRRRAQKRGVRPLRLHCTRHTWASLALASGKSVRWVADQLGHADPAMTLRVYAHLIPGEETDLSFLNFGGPGRPQTAPPSETLSEEEDAPDLSDRGRYENLARPTRLELVTFRSAT
jgi:integrase